MIHRTIGGKAGAIARHSSEPSALHCTRCGQPDDDDICAIAAEYRRVYPHWSSRRCFDRAWIAASKGAKAGHHVATLKAAAACVVTGNAVQLIPIEAIDLDEGAHA